MFRQFVGSVVNKVYGKELPIAEEMPTGYLLRVCCQRAAMLARGAVKGSFFGGREGLLFIGAHTTLRCKKMIYTGRSVSIQDWVLIDALSKEGVHIGNHSSIGMRTMIKTSGSLTKVGKGFWMGDYSAFGNDCFVGAAGGVRIGDYVAIGQNVRFHSENHSFDNPDQLISEQGVSNKGIEIGSDCWIGAGAVFLDGVHVGDHCVIGANTLVNKDVPPYSVAVGNPVRVVRDRRKRTDS